MGRLLGHWFGGEPTANSTSPNYSTSTSTSLKATSRPGLDCDELISDTDSPSSTSSSSSSSSSTSTAVDSSSTTSSSSSTASLSQPTTPPSCSLDSTMPTTSPITIATPSRNSSSSPSSHGQKPNYHDGDTRTSAIMSGNAFDSSMGRGAQNSFAGAKPISMNNPNRNNLDGRGRRESLAGSLVGGMSWGGVSVGSWIRDDIIMAGTSPFPYQSPSFHSSSYLPKLEAEFMKNFACCGKTLPSLHDLLQHYEESHAESTPQSLRNGSLAQRARENSTPNSKAHFQSEAASKIQQQSQHGQSTSQRPQIQIGQSGMGGIAALRQQQSQPSTPTQKQMPPTEDMDGVEDMEMDDAVGPMDLSNDLSVKPSNQPTQTAQPSMFGQQRPQLNLNASGMQHSGLRNNISQPTTPATAGFGFQNNPTVSSVNTPTLTAQPMQQQTFSPDTSVPGTPAEMEDDFAMQMNMNLGNMNMNLGNMNMGNMNGGQNMNFGFGIPPNDLGVDLCIDEPAKRLFSPNSGFNNQRQMQQQFAQYGLGGQAQQMGANNDMMRIYRQQQMLMMQGLQPNQAMALMASEEHKPFRCPVVGCEKAYKNQNGLKYHKTHGHTTQQLHENGDGTFSIVNPETSAPYPGTLGMEKEKPYKCEVCGKRYKNLNGLKYHKQHSPPCNPELKLNSQINMALNNGINNVNIPGLPGIGEEGLM
ncbi:Transcription factor SFP1 [Phlyctema vagabunda]|uniref:Transcription factor SFP1 n=1 Tax=Phlyctema vagabunda TaxID=108571 RepID=A0ABR4PP04_9HELO